ncbi:protein FAM124A isoform X1 [Stigmatopora nigra]
MEKDCVEDECEDSGAETAGSDYSPLSSTNSEVWMSDLQRDPFLVSVHLIADPGEGSVLQRATDSLLARLHPDLQLFRVSERAGAKRHHNHRGGTPRPALAVILFLQESDGEELGRPPWRYHHSEEVSASRRSEAAPSTQDFFTLGSGSPLWAVRQVRYGKGTLRLTLYCCHDNYAHTVRLYKLLLGRRLAYKKQDFCFLVAYSNARMEVQMAFRRLPRGRRPAPLDSAVVEVRVRDVGALVPLLPNACRPISDARWQTQDYDGNKILLQVQDVQWSARHHHQANRAPRHQASLRSLPLCGDEDFYPEWRLTSEGRGGRSDSLFSLPNLSCSPGPPGSPPGGGERRCGSLQRSATLVPPFRLNVDALLGADETDVDTGTTFRTGGVDLSVVSAYVPKVGVPASRYPEVEREGGREENVEEFYI